MMALEQEINYKLIKVKNGKNGRDIYRAVLNHDALSAEETMSEIVDDTKTPEYLVESIVKGTLRSMIRHTLADGRTRKFGEWFETRLDIEGNFDRIDSAFEEGRHKVVLNLLPLAEIGHFQRDMPPKNERIRPRGRIDYVTYPGGDKGEIKIGEDILVYGHDLALAEHDELLLKIKTCYGSQHYIAHLHVYPGEEPIVLEHDETHLRLKWFGCNDPSIIKDKEAMFYFNPWTREKRKPWQAPGRGSSTHVRIIT